MTSPELFSQALTILDHPSDPLVIHLEIGFTAEFRALNLGPEDFRRASLRLFSKHGRLRSALACEPEAFRLVEADAGCAGELNSLAWACDALSPSEFGELSIPFERAPLFRFRYRPGDGLFVACHHSLMDGFGCYELCFALLEELNPGGAIGSPDRARAPVDRPFWLRALSFWVTVADYVRMSGEIARNPTSLLGAAKPVESQRHGYLRAAVPISELRAAGATLNDLILAAFHLALRDFHAAARGSEPGRLSLTVPFNSRPLLPDFPLFANRMGYVSVSTLPAHRASWRAALARTQSEMTRAKKYRKEKIVQIIMSLYERLGLLRLARKTWLKRKLPSRYVSADGFFWKNLDTALVTNLGRIHVPEPYGGWIEAMHGFAPAISPTVSLAVLGYREQVFLGLRFGTATLTDEEGARLLQLLLARLGEPSSASRG